MYLYIPLALIFVAVAAITVIIGRKLPYLQKLTPDAHQIGASIWHDMFPELFSTYSSLNLHDSRAKILGEMEKLLRRVRLFFLSVDRLSDALIKKIRRVNKKSRLAAVSETTSKNESAAVSAKNGLKAKEQELIIAIAQNPKNATLYEQLGDVYVQMEDLTDAEESFKTALKLDSNNDSINKKLFSILEKNLKKE